MGNITISTGERRISAINSTTISVKKIIPPGMDRGIDGDRHVKTNQANGAGENTALFKTKSLSGSFGKVFFLAENTLKFYLPNARFVSHKSFKTTQKSTVLRKKNLADDHPPLRRLTLMISCSTSRAWIFMIKNQQEKNMDLFYTNICIYIYI